MGAERPSNCTVAPFKLRPNKLTREKMPGSATPTGTACVALVTELTVTVTDEFDLSCNSHGTCKFNCDEESKRMGAERPSNCTVAPFKLRPNKLTREPGARARC